MNNKFNNIAGKRFGKLKVTEYSKTDSKGRKWECVCDCGNISNVYYSALISGKTKSCGCSKYKPISDLTGQRFGKLVAINIVNKNKHSQYYWLCKCDCGNETICLAYQLNSGHTRSCGCIQREAAKHLGHKNKTHGKGRILEYSIWFSMKDRCYNLENKKYKDYGSRGITVCERWRNSIESFLEDMGERPSRKHSIDRIDNNGNYEPSNCRWATQKEQMNNTRINRIIEYNGELKTASQWADCFNISPSVLLSRIRCGWSIDKALTTPVKKYKKYDNNRTDPTAAEEAK